MVKQYPHFLLKVGATKESTQDSQGNWSIEKPSVVKLSACREEPDGRGTEVQTADGTYHRATSLIQLPKGAPRVEVGTSVVVANDVKGEDIRIKGVVLKFDGGQLHSRLWL